MYRLNSCVRANDTIRPNTNTLFGPLFSTEANTRYIPSSNFDSWTDIFVEQCYLISWEPKRWSSFDGLAPKTAFLLHSCSLLALWLTCEGTFTTMRLYHAFRSYGLVLHFGKWKHPWNVVHVLFNIGWPATNNHLRLALFFVHNGP